MSACFASAFVDAGLHGPALGVIFDSAGYGTDGTAPDETEDEVPEPPEDPVSKPGDLWVLGNHRVLCGDATILADVERVLGGQLADCGLPESCQQAEDPELAGAELAELPEVGVNDDGGTDEAAQ